MTPYRLPRFLSLGNLAFALLFVTALGVNLSRAAERADFDALTRSGWEHFYSLEYDQAFKDFERALEARPDDAAAVNHVLDAVLYRELYKYNALDTRLYAKQGFIFSRQVQNTTMKVTSSIKEVSTRLWPPSPFLSTSFPLFMISTKTSLIPADES